MVLDEATAPFSDGGFSEASSYGPGDFVGNDSQPPNDGAVRINIDILPKPMGFFGPLSPQTWDSPSRRELLVKSVNEASNAVGRRLTQDETVAITQKLASGLRTVSWCYSTGLGFGLLRTARTMDSYSFPFIKLGDKPWFNRDRFVLLRGSSANWAWHGLRFSAFSTIGILFAGMFFSSFAVTRDAALLAMDPRLKEYREALLARSRQKQGQLPQHQQRDPMRTSPVDQQLSNMEQASRDASTVPDWVKARQQQQQQQQQRTGLTGRRQRAADPDDMSPTGGAFMEDMTMSPSDGGLMSDSQLQAQDRRRQYEDSEAESNSAMTPSMASRSSQNDSRADVGGSAAPQGNTWERLRRQAADGGRGRTTPNGQEQRQGSTVGDDFTFSQRDEDRQLAQSEAQRDFDARLERERRGEDFQSSRGGRGW